MTDTVSRVMPSSLHIRLSQYCYWCVTFIIIIKWYLVKLWDDLMNAILGLRKPFLNNTFLLLANFLRKKWAIAQQLTNSSQTENCEMSTDPDPLDTFLGSCKTLHIYLHGRYKSHLSNDFTKICYMSLL